MIAWWKAFRDKHRENNEAEKTEAVETETTTKNDDMSDEEKELDETSKRIEEMLVGYVVKYGGMIVQYFTLICDSTAG